MWNYAANDRPARERAIFDGQDHSAPALAALGTVRGLDGANLVVEVVRYGGASALTTLPAVHHAVYAPGDRVLVLFQGADPASGVVAGRIDVLTDAVDGALYVRSDGSTPLSAAWDLGASGRIDGAEVRARSGAGLRLADDAGALGLFVADGGFVGVGMMSPQGALHLWDGVAGHLHATHTGIGVTARVLIAAGAGSVAELVRVEAIVSNGSARAFAVATLQHGGTTTQNATTGSDTWQFRLNANGSVDVRRTAGSGTATVIVRAMWL